MPRNISPALLEGLNDLLQTFADVEQTCVLRLLAEITDRELTNAEPITQFAAIELLVEDGHLTVAEAETTLLGLKQRKLLHAGSIKGGIVLRAGIRMRAYFGEERARQKRNAMH